MEEEEFVAYFSKQKESRSGRSCPAEEAKQQSQRCKYKCEICNFESLNRNYLTGHMTKHSDTKCKECNLQFKTMGLFRRHMQNNHEKKDKGEERQQKHRRMLTETSSVANCVQWKWSTISI